MLICRSIDEDEKAAIDESNIIKERTRGAEPRSQYQEPDDIQPELAE